MNFALAKTLYEQGQYKVALADLYAFMRAYPAAPEVASAAELILNYYNTRSDFKGLVKVSDKMLALKPRGDELGRRLASVRSKALVKRLDEQIKGQKGFDQFAQGKSYLQTALTSGDASLRSAAFEQALGRSKSERDIETFLKTAFAVAKNEPTATKRADLLNSMADETLAISRFNLTLKIWARNLNDRGVPAGGRAAASEKTVKLAMMLHDFERLAANLVERPPAPLPGETLKGARQVMAGVLDSPTPVSARLITAFTAGAQSDEDWLTLFKAQGKMTAATRASVLKNIRARCAQGQSILCKWSALEPALINLAKFKTQLTSVPPTIANVEPTAVRMNAELEELKNLRGGGDAQLDVVVTLASADAFDAFAGFLNRAAAANPDVAPVLKAKVSEGEQSARDARLQCKTIIQSAGLLSPVNAACARGRTPTVLEAVRWPAGPAVVAPTADPRSPEIDELQKKIFVDRKDWKAFFDLAESYLKRRNYHHAAATAAYGTSLFPQNQEEFNAVTGLREP